MKKSDWIFLAVMGVLIVGAVLFLRWRRKKMALAASPAPPGPGSSLFGSVCQAGIQAGASYEGGPQAGQVAGSNPKLTGALCSGLEKGLEYAGKGIVKGAKYVGHIAADAGTAGEHAAADAVHGVAHAGQAVGKGVKTAITSVFHFL